MKNSSPMGSLSLTLSPEPPEGALRLARSNMPRDEYISVSAP